MATMIAMIVKIVIVNTIRQIAITTIIVSTATVVAMLFSASLLSLYKEVGPIAHDRYEISTPNFVSSFLSEHSEY